MNNISAFQTDGLFSNESCLAQLKTITSAVDEAVILLAKDQNQTYRAAAADGHIFPPTLILVKLNT